MMERCSGQLQVLKMWQFCHMTELGHILSIVSLLDQSGVTGGGLDPYNVHALFVNMDNMWTERFGNYDCLVSKFKRRFLFYFQRIQKPL